jgi:capsular polysaccharide biosynthesis protein
MAASVRPRFLGRRWAVVLALVVVGAVIGAIFTAAQDTVYRAEATVVPSPANGVLNPAVAGDLEATARTVAEVAESDAVLAAVLRNAPALAEDVADLSGRIVATVPVETGVVRISAEAGTGADARRLAAVTAASLIQTVAALARRTPGTDDVQLAALGAPAVADQISPTPLANVLIGAASGLLLGLLLVLLLPERSREAQGPWTPTRAASDPRDGGTTTEARPVRYERVARRR